MIFCRQCYVPLSPQEIVYYGNHCDHCLRFEQQRVDDWKAGKDDKELDELYGRQQ